MFKSGEEWYHKSTLDIKLKIVVVMTSIPNTTRIVAHIFNRHNEIYYDTGTYTIANDQLHMWEKINK